MESAAIVTQDLSRIYRTYRKPEGLWNSVVGLFKRDHIEHMAVNNINLCIPKGQILGLVGANGAGKTTLLKLLSGLIFPSSGQARVLGFDPWQRSYAYLRKISILLGQKNQLWWDIPAMDSFSLLGKIYEIDDQTLRGRVSELAEVLDCANQLTIQLRRLSLGERMKMELIGALLHRPEIIFLDEPTIGLDILAQNAIRNFLKEYVSTYAPTIILTSHYMDDITHLAEHLLLISKGEIKYDGTLDNFMKSTEKKQKVSLLLEEPFLNEIELPNGLKIPPGVTVVAFEIFDKELAVILAFISSKNKIQKINIEETDFEDDIRRFLETQSRDR